MRQRLGIAAALLGRPDLVILDEPANGLDPNGVVDVRDLILALARDGITVFLSSHVLPEVEQLCDRVAILQKGRVIAEGATQEMLRQGERLYVRFESATDTDRARSILDAALGPVDEVGGSSTAEAGETPHILSIPRRPGEEVLRPLSRLGSIRPRCT